MVNSHVGVRAEAKRLKVVEIIRQTVDKVYGLYQIAEELAIYERALCRIIDEQPDSAGAKIAKAALRNFGMG